MLLLYTIPGVVISEQSRALAKEYFPNMSTQCLGKGKHFMAEEHPNAMGIAIRNWLTKIDTK